MCTVHVQVVLGDYECEYWQNNLQEESGAKITYVFVFLYSVLLSVSVYHCYHFPRLRFYAFYVYSQKIGYIIIDVFSLRRLDVFSIPQFKASERIECPTGSS